MELSNLNIKNGLCISLGANIDSKFGSPLESLVICKPKIEKIINEWGESSQEKKEEKSKFHANFFWSSIYETLPHGVENEQPNYCLLYTSPSPRDNPASRMPSSA